MALFVFVSDTSKFNYATIFLIASAIAMIYYSVFRLICKCLDRALIKESIDADDIENQMTNIEKATVLYFDEDGNEIERAGVFQMFTDDESDMETTEEIIGTEKSCNISSTRFLNPIPILNERASVLPKFNHQHPLLM